MRTWQNYTIWNIWKENKNKAPKEHVEHQIIISERYYHKTKNVQNILEKWPLERHHNISSYNVHKIMQKSSVLQT